MPGRVSLCILDCWNSLGRPDWPCTHRLPWQFSYDFYTGTVMDVHLCTQKNVNLNANNKMERHWGRHPEVNLWPLYIYTHLNMKHTHTNHDGMNVYISKQLEIKED